jgi:hypothetical protein
MAAKEHIAVLLRGSIGVGKSTVVDILLSKLGQPAKTQANLDSGWGEHEFRYTNKGAERYADLAKRQEPVLFIELSCGEPFVLGLSGHGATLNPREWISILDSENRRLHAFLLTAPWADTETRLRQRSEPSLPAARQFYDLYQDARWRDFAARAGIDETVINTDGLSADDVADLVWGRLST